MPGYTGTFAEECSGARCRRRHLVAKKTPTDASTNATWTLQLLLGQYFVNEIKYPDLPSRFSQFQLVERLEEDRPDELAIWCSNVAETLGNQAHLIKNATQKTEICLILASMNSFCSLQNEWWNADGRTRLPYWLHHLIKRSHPFDPLLPCDRTLHIKGEGCVRYIKSIWGSRKINISAFTGMERYSAPPFPMGASQFSMSNSNHVSTLNADAYFPVTSINIVHEPQGLRKFPELDVVSTTSWSMATSHRETPDRFPFIFKDECPVLREGWNLETRRERDDSIL
ncbi:uncharacterized protein EI90DRAFT_3018218 [Cantharellus anzutake]|uniref:uncharacterized protein n=1 Tax=Cantharellus anzutake TaxID=1750568 RepID=UPI0019044414|nr:uncharacterized protein EI90DRAFT_3018218 [Cantharellus anzutake]KAF8327485.1 hypothetical protein EI90DRAFT_3018218 [Cantharellus anzutake]